MIATLGLERSAELASEYKIAYQQLQHVERKVTSTLLLLENDRRLALKRYELAREAWSKLALGEDDEFLDEQEPE